MTIDAADVARRVARCNDVARLTGGLGGVGTPVVGDRWIEGVRVLDPGIEVHVVARWGFTVDALTAQVRKTLGSLAFPVDVIIDDVETPYDPAPEDAHPSVPSADPKRESTDPRSSSEVAVVPIVVPVMPVAETLVVIVEAEPPSAEPSDHSSAG